MPFRDSYDDSPSFGVSKKMIAIGIIAVLAVVTVLVYLFNSYDRVEPGSVGLVRNGGTFDNRNFQRVINVSDGYTNVGWGSTVTLYPTGDLYDDVEPGTYREDPAAGDTGSVDKYRVRTLDGQDVGVQGQWRYTLNTDPKALEVFDAKFGIRDYGLPGTTDRYRLSDGTDGLRAFIYNQMRQPQEEAIQTGFGATPGAKLDPSLALLTVTSTDPNEIAKANAAVAASTDAAGTFATLSETISTAGETAINKALGAPEGMKFFTGVRFSLRAIGLAPDTADKVQAVRNSVADLAKANADAAAAVAAANGAAQKAVADAEGRRLTAEKDASAQVARQAGYNACSTCAEIDRINAQGEAQKAANSGWGTPPQVYAPGSTSGFIPVPQR